MKKLVSIIFATLLVVFIAFGAMAEMTISAPYVKKGPKLDGKLDDEAWKIVEQKGAKAEIAYYLNALAVKEDKSEVMVCWDNDFLYIAFKNMQKEDTIFAEAVADGASIWVTDDDNEVFLSTTYPGTRPFLQAITNALGVKTSFNVGTIQDWDVAVEVYKDYWISEFAIPFDMLNAWPEASEEWAINLCRRYANGASTEREWMTWCNLPVTTFLDPLVFGVLLFTK